jgi:Tol biopolymer transport system component
MAYVAPLMPNAGGGLTVFDLISREKRVIFPGGMGLANPTWTADQRSLLVLYTVRGEDGPPRPQIGAVSYPDGVFRTITNDTNSYSGFRVSADGRSLVSIVSKSTSTIAFRPASAAPSSPSTPVVESRAGITGLAWTNDGGILYALRDQLRERAANGRERIVLEAGAGSRLSGPLAGLEICRGSGQIVLSARLRGATAVNLWRLDADGGGLFQLTDLPHAQSAQCSPDGQWVAFLSASGLARVRLSGGPVESLDSSLVMGQPAWSPDSRTIVIMVGGSPARDRDAVPRLVLVSPGAPRRYLDAVADAGDAAFTPDGSAIRYLARKNGTLNLYIQPIDGSAPRVTAAPNDALGGLVSPDGSTVAVRSGRTDSDVVLLRDGAPPRR